MPTADERLASLEARVDGVNDLRTLIAELRGDMNRQFADVREDMNRQLTEVREDMKELRGDMNRQFADVRADMKGTDQKVDRLFLYLDQKTDRQFTWLVGTQLALLLAVVGALVGAYYR